MHQLELFVTLHDYTHVVESPTGFQADVSYLG